MSKQQRGLGRGLESLIPTEVIKEQLQDGHGASVRKIPVDAIKPNPHQPRKSFNQEAIDNLAESLQEHGLIQPVVAVKAGENFQLIAGERRLRAAKKNKWKTIDAIIRSASEQKQAQLALVENIQRDDLNALEVAGAYVKLLEEFDFSFDQLSKSAGKADTTIRNTIRLLNLPKDAKKALREGKITEGHARQVLAAPSGHQSELIELIVKHGWSVRQAEQFVKSLKNKDSTEKAIKRTMTENEFTKELQKSLGLKVQQKNMANGGRIIIDFKNESDLERIRNLLA